MLNLLRTVDPIGLYYTYGAVDQITGRIRNRSTANPDIQLNLENAHIFGYRYPMHPFVIIGFQALSKILTRPLTIWEKETYGNSQSREDQVQQYLTEVAEQGYTITFCDTTRHTLSKRAVREARKMFDTDYDKAQDDTLEKITESVILGKSYGRSKNHIIFFGNHYKNGDITAIYQYLILVTAYRLLTSDPNVTIIQTHPSVHKLFNDLAIALKNYLTEKEPDREPIRKAFLDYAENEEQIEYRIDTQNEFDNMIKQLRGKRLKIFERKVESARSRMEMALYELEAARKSYDEVNETYILMKTKASDVSNIKDALDLLKRSTRIECHGIEGTRLWYKIKTPLRVNNKERWEKVSKNLVTRPDLRDLLNEVLIEEKYELWTTCTVALDLETGTVSRYTNAYDAAKEMPHPHIAGFNCFGQHSPIIGNLIAEGDILGAIEQTIEAASGINWADAPVIERLVQSIYVAQDCKCFKDQSGEWFSLVEYAQRRTPVETTTQP